MEKKTVKAIYQWSTIGLCVAMLAWTYFLPSLQSTRPPGYRLTTLGEARVNAISFFLLVLLFGTWGIQLVWNVLRKDFSRWPRLSYGRALGLSVLWGLIFGLMLTMVSGARELMTPGAWAKPGTPYYTVPAEGDIPARRERLADLREALWVYARTHRGELPADDRVAEIPQGLWETPDLSRMRYGYRGGGIIGGEPRVVAYEPPIYPTQLVLMNDGELVVMTWDALQRHLQQGTTP